MNFAIKDIVDAYLKMGNWAAIEGLRAHRLGLKELLPECADKGFNAQKAMDALSDDLR
jgi:hypothetical protein